jgi:carbon-monoxide dehydrogenase medium subunit
MNHWEAYLRPTNLAEALQFLASARRPLAPIAGGTDLLLDLAQGRHSPVVTLLDITSVEEFLVLETRADRLFVGAGVPLTRIVQSPLVRQHAMALVEACELIGGPQVRNVATLGGNVAHALPAADGTIALLALDAEVEVADRSGTRRLPLEQLFVGPGQSALRHGEELLVGFYLPIRGQADASAFRRIMRPQGVALPIINCAIWLRREGELVEDLRLAVGPGSPIPWRARDAERALAGKALTAETAHDAVNALLAGAAFRSSARRATSEYRRHLVVDLFENTLHAAWGRAAQGASSEGMLAAGR